MDTNSPKQKWVKTGILVSLMFTKAICVNGFYSLLIDFSQIFNTSIANVALGLSVRSAGASMGSLAGTGIFKLGDHLTIAALFLFTQAVSLLVLAQAHSLPLYYSCLFLIGFTTGTIETALYVTITKVWMERSGPFIQALDLADILAGVAAPLCIRPFLSRESAAVDVEFVDSVDVTITAREYSGSVWIPLSCFALAMVAIAVTAILFQCYSRAPDGSKEECTGKSEASAEEVQTTSVVKDPLAFYNRWVVVPCCTLSFLGCGFLLLFNQFWPVFVVFCDLKFPKEKGVLMLSVMSFTSALSSIGSVFIAIKMTPLKMLMLMWSLLVSGSTLILFYGNTCEPLLWLGAVLITAGIANFFPTSFSCLTDRVNITNFGASLILFCAYILPASGVPGLIGHHMYKEPLTLIYSNLILCTLILAAAAALYSLDLCKRRIVKSTKSNVVLLKARRFHFTSTTIGGVVASYN